MNEELKKRIFSLLWRAGGMALVAGVAVISNALPELQQNGLPAIIVAGIGLALGEVTKFLNKRYQLGRAK